MHSSPSRNLKLLALCALSVLAAACAPDPCEADKISFQNSPDGKLQAIAFRQRCGPKAPYTTHVAVIPKPNPIDPTPKEGNVMIYNSDVHISLMWKDAANLQIMSPAQIHPVRQETLANGVHITYSRND